MKKATLCFPVNLDDKGKVERVVLGMKKIGFGKGKWNGFGGKLEEGETIEEAAVRELREESGMIASLESLILVGEFCFTFPHKPDDNMDVTAYVVPGKTKKRLQESDEMRPRYFLVKDIPYDKMWLDDKFWLPQALEMTGMIRGDFEFGEDGELDEWSIQYERHKEIKK